jgi:hypothetical protein
MSDPTKPPPNPPGPWDHEDPPSDIRPGFIPKRPKVPKPIKDSAAKDVTLGWLDEPAAPGDYAEIVRRAARAPSTLVHMVTIEACGDSTSILSAARDGDPIPKGHDDAGISLDYDPVEVCAVNFAQIIGEELYQDDAVEIDADEDLPSVTIGAFTFTISTTIRGGAERCARSLHALGEALRHSAWEE